MAPNKLFRAEEAQGEEGVEPSLAPLFAGWRGAGYISLPGRVYALLQRGFGSPGRAAGRSARGCPERTNRIIEDQRMRWLVFLVFTVAGLFCLSSLSTGLFGPGAKALAMSSFSFSFADIGKEAPPAPWDLSFPGAVLFCGGIAFLAFAALLRPWHTTPRWKREREGPFLGRAVLSAFIFSLATSVLFVVCLCLSFGNDAPIHLVGRIFALGALQVGVGCVLAVWLLFVKRNTPLFVFTLGLQLLVLAFLVTVFLLGAPP